MDFGILVENEERRGIGRKIPYSNLFPRGRSKGERPRSAKYFQTGVFRIPKYLKRKIPNLLRYFIIQGI